MTRLNVEKLVRVASVLLTAWWALLPGVSFAQDAVPEHPQGSNEPREDSEVASKASQADLTPPVMVGRPAHGEGRSDTYESMSETELAQEDSKAPRLTEGKRMSDGSRTWEISGAPGDGLTLRANDSYSLNIRSRIQLRYQFSASHEDELGERSYEQLATVGTARIWLSGNVLSPEVSYVIQLAVAARDYREEARSPLYDAYLDARHHRDLNLRVGQFFVPFDRLRTIREWALQMPDRPRPVQEFTLDRDVGVVLYSERFLGDESPLTYKAGVFGGGGNNLTAGKEPGALLVGRLELRPLGPIDDDLEGDLQRRTRPGLALGVGAAQNMNTNRLRSTTGARFSGGTTDYTHLAADAVFKWRGFAFEAAYLWKEASSNEIMSLDDAGMPFIEHTRAGYGWVTQASYAMPQGFEIVARASRMFARAQTDPGFVTEVRERGQELGVGLNYYLNGHKMKLQGDLLAFMPPVMNFERADHVGHLQLDATF